jgi:hypothetical protein
VQNSVSSVSVLSGWTLDKSDSNSSALWLNGPSASAVDILGQQVPSSDTVADILTDQYQKVFQANSNFTDVSICGQGQSGDLPGTPSLSGAYAQFCFDVTTQSGSAAIDAIVFDALVPLSSGSGQSELLTEVAYVPQSDGKNAFTDIAQPELNTIHWLGMSSS